MDCRPTASGPLNEDAAVPDCEIDRSCHDCPMRLEYGFLFLAAQMAVMPVNASVADRPLPPSVRSLFEAVGVAPEAYVHATDTCERSATNIGGVEGVIAIESGSYNCRGSSPGVDAAQIKPTLLIAFQAKLPVTKCISFERAESYLRDHRWKRVPDKAAHDLLPIAVDFTDGAGSTLTLEPYLRNSCLTTVNLEVGAPLTDRSGL